MLIPIPAPTSEAKRRRANDGTIISASPGAEFITSPLGILPAAKRALYIFSGIKRRASIGDFLSKKGWSVTELDILRNQRHDLTRKHNQDAILAKIENKQYHLLITSPPCDSFSRVKFANRLGPPPTRSKKHLRGVPGLPAHLRRLNLLGNVLADFSYAAVLAQLRNPVGYNMVIKEHPEDLGVVTSGPFRGQFPASIWQFPQHEECIKAGALSVGFRQSDFGMPYVKPTRLLILLPGPLPKEFFPGVPVFSEDGRYLGPIPRTNNYSATLAKSSAHEPFRTTGTAAWPPQLCRVLANLADASPSVSNAPASTAVTSLGDNPWLAEEAPPSQSPLDKQDIDYPVTLPPTNFNKGGTGDPRSVFSLGKTHNFHDGAGLCSPGRFEKQDRSFPQGRRWELLRAELEKEIIGGMDSLLLQKQLLALCCGKEHLFKEDWAPNVRSILHRWLQKQAGDYTTADEPDLEPGQPFYLDLFKFLLREARDPDFAIIDSYKSGVNLGVTEPLPHTPAVFELQERWRLKIDPLEQASWLNPNYSSLQEHKAKIKEQFLEEEKEGLVGRTTVSSLKTMFPEGFAISALSVLEEKDKLRLLHDGSHVTLVNHRIRSRDKLRCPGPREKAYLLNGFKQRGQIGLSLLCDVSKAHRRVKIKRRDWGWQACTLEDLTKLEGEALEQAEVWFHKVGTFGMASASYWWGRLGAIIIRLLYILLGPAHRLDTLLYADDLELIAECKEERLSIFLAIVYMVALGVPLKWSKFRGGFQLDWVGFFFCHRTHAVGLSPARADWLIDWITQTLKNGLISGADFSSALGRLNFSTMALIHEKPFLGILYAWSSSIGFSDAVFRLPWAVRMILFWLSKRLGEEKGRLMDSCMIAQHPSLGTKIELFRSDAKATDKGAWIGGWEFKGGQDPKNARWFAFEVDKSVFPWLFVKKDPKRIIASLEMLATVVCIMLFGSTGTLEGIFTGGTDNQSNTFSVQKLISTKFPLTILLMELSEQLRTRNASLSLRWVPRLDNQPADDLTNNKFDLFESSLRIDIDPAKLPFLVLPVLNDSASKLFNAIVEEKKLKIARQPVLKRSIKDRLKWKSPW